MGEGGIRRRGEDGKRTSESESKRKGREWLLGPAAGDRSEAAWVLKSNLG